MKTVDLHRPGNNPEHLPLQTSRPHARAAAAPHLHHQRTSGRQIRRQHGPNGRPTDSSTTPGPEPPQVGSDDDELQRAPPPEKNDPTPKHPPPAPPPPTQRRRGLHPILPYVQAGAGDPPPSRRRGGRRRRGIPQLGGEHAVDRPRSPKNRLPLCYSDGRG